MQGAVRAALTARLAAAAWLAAGALGAVPHASAQSQRGAQVQINADVAPGKHRALRLGNVPAEARVAIAVQASSKITLFLLNEADARRFPATEEPLFSAPVERTFSFSVTIPATGNYYVVFDNAKGDTVSRVRLVLRASRGGANAQAAPEVPAPPAPPREGPSPLLRKPGTHDM